MKKDVIIGVSHIAEVIGWLSTLCLEDIPAPIEEEFWYLKKNKISIGTLGELMLVINPLVSIEEFKNKFSKLEDDVFIYCLLGESIEMDIIKKRDYNRVDKEYLVLFSFLIKNRGVLKDIVLRLIVNSHKIITLNLDSSYHKKHLEFKKRVENMLLKLHPLNVSQDLMGKRFWRISDYSSYIFLSTNYSLVPCMRYFNGDTLITLSNINTFSEEISEEKLLKFTKILSDKTRINILKFISKKPSFGIEISETFSISRPTVSHHLDTFNKIGLVHIERVKNTKYYSLNRINYDRYLKELKKFVLNE